jgi:hypothetical protein
MGIFDDWSVLDVATLGYTKLSDAALGTSLSGDGGDSDHKYTAEPPTAYGAGEISVEESKYAAARQEELRRKIAEARANPNGAVAAERLQEQLDELDQAMARRSYATKERDRFVGMADANRASGTGWANEFRDLSGKFEGAGNADLGRYTAHVDAANRNVVGMDSFIDNDLKARALGGYAGSASQMAAEAQAADARRALASAQASRGGAFKGAGATANALVDAQRSANNTGINAFNQEKNMNQQAYLNANAQRVGLRQGLGALDANTQLAAANTRMQGLQGAVGARQSGAGAELGFHRSAQGYESQGQAGAMANVDATEAGRRRADAAAAANAAQKTGDEKFMEFVIGAGSSMAAGYGGRSDSRVKWGAKRQKPTTKLDALISKAGGK